MINFKVLLLSLLMLSVAFHGKAKDSNSETSQGAIQYAIKKHTIDAGGGQSAAGQFKLTGTMGQFDGNHLASGGFYVFKGGFHSKHNNDLIFQHGFD
ncbi:hypothetical protein [Marinicella litoralis]|uniref:Uncharacterized protein n=1 Tax=Marinicella litoralis TaxID=644220 RepID=A0A4V3DI27_9GAMM|nr:hypothetical protein [Marinicella litoralis]TDR20511.1 hypothetical protein C8D91_1485 [Marinicella litoralis]